MAKSKPRGIPPSQRPGRGSRPNPAGRPALTPEETRGLAAAENAARMHQIEEYLASFQPDLPDTVRADEAPVFERDPSRTTGAEVADHHLLNRSASTVTASLETIDAHPHPDKPDVIAVRLGGNDGHLQLNVSRDRALLLATRLTDAVEKAHAWYDKKR